MLYPRRFAYVILCFLCVFSGTATFLQASQKSAIEETKNSAAVDDEKTLAVAMIQDIGKKAIQEARVKTFLKIFIALETREAPIQNAEKFLHEQGLLRSALTREDLMFLTQHIGLYASFFKLTARSEKTNLNRLVEELHAPKEFLSQYGGPFAIYRAIANNQQKTLESLLANQEENGIDVKKFMCTKTETTQSLLRVACVAGHTQITITLLRYCIDHGIDTKPVLNTQNGGKNTILHWLVFREQPDVLPYIIANHKKLGFNFDLIYAANDAKMTVLHLLLVQYENKVIDTLKFLHQQGASLTQFIDIDDKKDKLSFFRFAIAHVSEETIIALLAYFKEHHIDIATEITCQDSLGWNFIHACALKGANKVFTYLIKHRAALGIDIRKTCCATTKNGQTFLHLAAVENNINIIDCALKECQCLGIDILAMLGKKDDFNKSLLSCAACNKQEEMLQVLAHYVKEAVASEEEGNQEKINDLSLSEICYLTSLKTKEHCLLRFITWCQEVGFPMQKVLNKNLKMVLRYCIGSLP